MYFITRDQKEKWLEIWQMLTAILSGGETEYAKITETEITSFCEGYAYEGTDTERGHCFAKRGKSGRKHFIYIEQ